MKSVPPSANPFTATIHAIPVAPRLTDKENVLKFLDDLRADVESGTRPISDIIMIAIEDTEYTIKNYALTTGRLNHMEIIGNLQAMATQMVLEDYIDDPA